MFVWGRVRNALFAGGLSAAITGCGGGGASGPGPIIPDSHSVGEASPLVAAGEFGSTLGPFGELPDASLAGTYDGTFVEKSGGVTIGGGTLVITLKLKLPDVSGTVALTAAGQTVKVPFTGTGHQMGGALKMELMGSTPAGCKAQGPGEIVGTKFTGSFVIASCNGAPAVTITYKTTKK